MFVRTQVFFFLNGGRFRYPKRFYHLTFAPPSKWTGPWRKSRIKDWTKFLNFHGTVWSFIAISKPSVVLPIICIYERSLEGLLCVKYSRNVFYRPKSFNRVSMHRRSRTYARGTKADYTKLSYTPKNDNCSNNFCTLSLGKFIFMTVGSPLPLSLSP